MTRAVKSGGKQTMEAIQAIDEVATELGELQLEDVTISDRIQALRDRLYGIKLALRPVSEENPGTLSEVDETGSAVAVRLSVLSAEFDAMLDRMQSPEVRAGIDAAFRASPQELRKAAEAAASKSGRKRG